MLVRSIDSDALGPTFEERLVCRAKATTIALAIVAASVAFLDLVSANALTHVAALIHDGRMNYDELPDRLLAGIRQISIYSDRTSVVVAIPRDIESRMPIAQLRPAAMSNGPLKLTPVAAERQRLALKMPASNAAIAALADANSADAVELAMTHPAGIVAAAPLSPSPAETPVPATAINHSALTPATATEALAAYHDDSPPVRLASLNAATLPVSVLATDSTPISLPPLSMVPLPTPAPGVPPPSPAQRLHLDAKGYAKAERCLANAVYWEARSEPVRGQMAVAQVVLNRAFSPFYPNDVCAVVYQNANRHLACQFTFACDGKRKVINERGSWARANRIAKQTLDGQIYVPEVAKSTHYHAAYVNPIWNREMRKMVRFGLHSFYRPYAWGNGAGMPVWGKTALAKVETKKK